MSTVMDEGEVNDGLRRVPIVCSPGEFPLGVHHATVHATATVAFRRVRVQVTATDRDGVPTEDGRDEMLLLETLIVGSGTQDSGGEEDVLTSSWVEWQGPASVRLRLPERVDPGNRVSLRFRRDPGGPAVAWFRCVLIAHADADAATLVPLTPACRASLARSITQWISKPGWPRRLAHAEHAALRVVDRAPGATLRADQRSLLEAARDFFALAEAEIGSALRDLLAAVDAVGRS